MNLEKMKEVFSDEEFVKSLFDLETPEQVQDALEEKEIVLSTEEICQMRDLLIRYQEGTLTEEEQKAMELAEHYGDDELSDEELENVSGGGIGLAIGAACVVVMFIASWVHEGTEGRW